MKITGKWTPHPDFVGNNLQLEEPTLEQQIENEKISFARRVQAMQRDFEQNMEDLRQEHQDRLAGLMYKKASLDNQDHSSATGGT